MKVRGLRVNILDGSSLTCSKDVLWTFGERRRCNRSSLLPHHITPPARETPPSTPQPSILNHDLLGPLGTTKSAATSSLENYKEKVHLVSWNMKVSVEDFQG